MFPCLSTSENNVTELLCFLSSFPVCPGLFSSTIDPRCSIYNPYSTEQQTIQPEEKENEANANTAGMFVKPYLTISCMYTTVHIAFSYICYLKNVGKVGKPEHPQNLPPPPPPKHREDEPRQLRTQEIPHQISLSYFIHQ